MPCTYYESPEEKREAARKARDRRHVELDRVTELLCKVCETLTSEDFERMEDRIVALNRLPGLAKWWVEHQHRDALRKSK